MVSQKILYVLVSIVAFVTFYGGFLIGLGTKRIASVYPTPTASPTLATATILPTPIPSNPLGNVNANPFEGIKFNPFQ